MTEPFLQLPKLARNAHASYAKICLSGLPASQVKFESSRMALIFYCLGTLDLLDLLESKTNAEERQLYKDWIWEQHTSGKYGTGFKPSSFMTAEESNGQYGEYDAPHLVMTYTALLSLCILRDDFAKLNRRGLLKFIRACQLEDGSFSAVPHGPEADLRTVYCAFALSSMLDDWSGMNVDRAVAYIRRCRSYEGGYGQTPFGEALGGTTYCALACLYLAPSTTSAQPTPSMSSEEFLSSISWLLQKQTPSGGFCGRTNKLADACYCFWCGAALSILGAGDLVDSAALASFLNQCQFKFGGIAKAIGDHSDPYHTYLSLSALALYPPKDADPSWQLPQVDPLWNAKRETVRWGREHIPNSVRRDRDD